MKITRRQLKQMILEAIAQPRMRGQNNRSGYTSGIYEDDVNEDRKQDLENKKELKAWLSANPSSKVEDFPDYDEWGSEYTRSLNETREAHIQGIRNKIARLESELEVQKAALSRIGARSEEAMAGEWGVGDAMEIESRWGDPVRLNMFGVEDKADLLRRQLDSLESAEGGSVEDWPRD